MNLARKHATLWSMALLMALMGGALAATNSADDIKERIQRGESFLTNLFDAQLNLLPEYRGSRTFWLFHDNYLPAHLLDSFRPDLSRRIRSTLDRLRVEPPHRAEVVARLLVMQSPAGGWITDYRDGKPIGLANVETTCLSLLALKTLRD